ncbi:MAG: hypothetical protein IKR41_04485 [Bacteroidales bacterium]|nr:hypothetical protein [Bacteroidales bacterium]
MLEEKVKLKCCNCGKTFEKKVFDSLHTGFLKCPYCGSFNVKSINEFSSILDFLKRKNKN